MACSYIVAKSGFLPISLINNKLFKKNGISSSLHVRPWRNGPGDRLISQKNPKILDSNPLKKAFDTSSDSGNWVFDHPVRSKLHTSALSICIACLQMEIGQGCFARTFQAFDKKTYKETNSPNKPMQWQPKLSQIWDSHIDASLSRQLKPPTRGI